MLIRPTTSMIQSSIAVSIPTGVPCAVEIATVGTDVQNVASVFTIVPTPLANSSTTASNPAEASPPAALPSRSPAQSPHDNGLMLQLTSVTGLRGLPGEQDVAREVIDRGPAGLAQRAGSTGQLPVPGRPLHGRRYDAQR